MSKRISNLSEDRTRFKPFNYPWAYDAWLKHEQSHWLHSEVPMAEDVKDWKNKLSKEEKQFLTHIFRFFTQGDIDVAGGYVNNYLPYFPQPEVRMMLLGFAAREALHIAAYSHLIETLGLPDSEYHAFLDYSEMADKIDYMRKADTNTLRGLGLSIAESVFNEGVALFASFVMLLNFQRFGKMKGMGKVVEWSIRDESIHVEGNSKLFKAFIKEHSRVVDDEFKKEIYEMSKDIVDLEDKFIDLAYAMGNIEGLEKSEVKEYIKYITDRRLLQLGMKPNFKVKDNPLPWLEWVLNGADHTNFFENRVTEYEVAGLEGTWDDAYAS